MLFYIGYESNYMLNQLILIGAAKKYLLSTLLSIYRTNYEICVHFFYAT